MHRSTVSGWDGVAAFLGLKHSNRVACLAFFVGENNGDLGAGDAGAPPGRPSRDETGAGVRAGDPGGVRRSTTFTADDLGRAGEARPSSPSSVSTNDSFFFASSLLTAPGSGLRPAPSISSESESCAESSPTSDGGFRFDAGVRGAGVLARGAEGGAEGVPPAGAGRRRR